MEKIRKSREEWRALLSDDEFHVCREKGTERAFTGKYWHCDGSKGTYHCRCCGMALFHSDAKFDSGTGWPSFTHPAAPGHVEERPDDSLGMSRTEVLCARCEAHLGHVFPDGPAPGGLRYCINSISLTFSI